jgi:predicted hotdog family 3-hydroxylacyl-ACP dehydratase
LNDSGLAASSPESLTQNEIRALLPHAGAMCLLDSVLAWDMNSISCSSLSHCLPNNPLRAATGLASANGIEYAAQAMALHAALVSGAASTKSSHAASPPVSLLSSSPVSMPTGELPERPQGQPPEQPPHGVLASVRAVQLHVARLDVYAGALTVRAVLLSGDPSTAIYEFSIASGALMLVQGRASVLFDARR